jgi:hypothetical protein
MREFLDSILEFIESESLTDEEFATVDDSLPADYTKEVYQALRTILEARENVSGQVKRLTEFFQAKGVDLSDPTTPTPASNILIGGAL